ncbi:MAG: hypothetical protein AAF436_03545 [Myxococcota bacterium]
MNFFGHAVVAAWKGQDAFGVLGSMLPDFEGMTHVRVLEVRQEALRAGVALHHETDDAFHQSRVFVSLCRVGLDELTELGVRRGTARAVAHVGVEMFLDGLLTSDAGHGSAYDDALRQETHDAVLWEDQGLAFGKLQRRLRNWGTPHEYRDPTFVLDRLTDSLRTRPRLAILGQQRAAVADFLPRLQQSVEVRAPELLNELRDTLGLAR